MTNQVLAALQAIEPATTRLTWAIVTPWKPEYVGQELVYAWTRMFGSGPTARSVAILMAQWALETGWGKSCWCSNLGNVRPPMPRGDVLCLQIPGGKVSEIIDGKEYFFSPPSVGSTFRAFESLPDGCDFWLGLLHKRFAHAWPSVVAGDPEAYSIALHEQHYYTADVTIYTRTVVSLFNHFLSIAVMGSSATPPPELPSEIVSAVQRSHAADWLAALDMDQDESGASNIPPELG